MQQHEYFGKRYAKPLAPEAIYKATRNRAEDQITRMLSALEQMDAEGDIDVLIDALCEEGQIYPQTVIRLMMDSERFGGAARLRELKRRKSEQCSIAAKTKSKRWIAWMADAWAEEEGDVSLLAFCKKYANTIQQDGSGGTVQMKSQKHMYDTLCKMRREGKLSPDWL